MPPLACSVTRMDLEMARKTKKDEAASEAMMALEYVVERQERLLAELRRKQTQKDVTRLVAPPLPKAV